MDRVEDLRLDAVVVQHARAGEGGREVRRLEVCAGDGGAASRGEGGGQPLLKILTI